MLWEAESEDYLLDWWDRHGNHEVVQAVRDLARAVEDDELYQRYQVHELQGPASRFSVVLPVYGACVVIDIWDDRVELISILTDHWSDDEYEIP